MGSILLSCWLITLHVAVLMLKTMLINVIFGCFAGPERTQEKVAVFTFKALHRSRLPSEQFIHIQKRHRKHDPIPSELQSPVFPTDWDHRGVRSRGGAKWITLVLHCPSVNNSVFSKSFTLKRTRLSEAWDWHAGDTMRIQHLWGTMLYFSIQRKLSFHSKFSYKPPKWH